LLNVGLEVTKISEKLRPIVFLFLKDRERDFEGVYFLRELIGKRDSQRMKIEKMKIEERAR
jgi:hypothetical protein